MFLIQLMRSEASYGGGSLSHDHCRLVSIQVVLFGTCLHVFDGSVQVVVVPTHSDFSHTRKKRKVGWRRESCFLLRAGWWCFACHIHLCLQMTCAVVQSRAAAWEQVIQTTYFLPYDVRAQHQSRPSTSWPIIMSRLARGSARTAFGTGLGTDPMAHYW